MVTDTPKLNYFSAFAQVISGVPSPMIARTEINRYIVSTVNTGDAGPETAILDAEGAHPVERYLTVQDARTGHAKWCTAVQDGQAEFTELGYGALVPAKAFSLGAPPND